MKRVVFIMLLFLLSSCNHLNEGDVISKRCTEGYWQPYYEMYGKMMILQHRYIWPEYYASVKGVYEGKEIIEEFSFDFDRWNEIQVGSHIVIKQNR